MKALFFSTFLAVSGLIGFAKGTNSVFTGAWSDAVNGLQMRLIVTSKQENPEFQRAVVYLEMKNVANVINPIEFPSQFSLTCQVTNSIGNPPPIATGMANGPICPPFWIYIPCDSTLKMRVDDMNAWAVRYKNQTGVSLAVGSGIWLVPDGATNEYFLTGVFKVEVAMPPPPEHVHVWTGTIHLPAVAIPFQD